MPPGERAPRKRRVAAEPPEGGWLDVERLAAMPARSFRVLVAFDNFEPGQIITALENWEWTEHLARSGYLEALEVVPDVGDVGAGGTVQAGDSGGAG